MAFNFQKKQLFSEANLENIKQSEQSISNISKSHQNGCIEDEEKHLFSEYELTQEVLEALTRIGYEKPTKIQYTTLQHSLKDQDLLCLSETGSGKTLSFVLPIVNYLSKQINQNITGGIALILAPTRQLCIQINEYFVRFLEAGMERSTSCVLYGGVDPMKQVLELSKKPCVIVGTPGRILDHLSNTKGFNLTNLKYLVLDEADKLLNKDFEAQFNEILEIIPKQRNAYLFSATLTQKIEKLQRVSLKNPIRIEVNQKYHTVDTLEQFYIFIPSKMKDCYLVYLLNKNNVNKTIIFAQTRLGSERIALILKSLNFSVDCLHGDMSQVQRLKSLEKFKKDEIRILVCTDVAARGIDISEIQFVINYDLCDAKNYIHRVGRTARIGKQGIAISIVTQYDVETFKKIEEKMNLQMKEYQINQKEAQVFLEKLELVHQEVSSKMKRQKKHFKTDF